jgi:hypothetical protein
MLSGEAVQASEAHCDLRTMEPANLDNTLNTRNELRLGAYVRFWMNRHNLLEYCYEGGRSAWRGR